MNKEKIEYYAHLTVSVLGVIIGAYLFARYIFLAVLPFLIAWTAAFSIRPLANKLATVTKLPERLVSATVGSVAILCILTLLIGTLIYAVGEAWDLLSSINTDKRLYVILERLLNPLENFFGDSEGARELEKQISEALGTALTSALSALVSFVTEFVSSVPRVILFVLITLIATVYFCLDLERVNRAVRSILPKKVSEVLARFKDKFLATLLKYLRSYLLLMLITFVMMFVGFLLLDIPFAILLAFIVALLDALPLIGVGAVLIPWGVFELLFGSLSRGIGLIVLFFISWIVRQLTEPRIVGKSLGIHPIISLMLLYLGYSFFGVLGLLIIPVAVVIINTVVLKKDDSAAVK